MVMLNLLRMIVDLAFYGAFADFVSACFGGQSIMGGLFILSICFGFSSRLRSLQVGRLLVLSGIVFCLGLVWMIRPAFVDCIVLLPPVVYVFYMVWTGNYQLSWYRQVDIFSVFWKIFFAFAVFMFLIGKYRLILSVSTPMALLMVLSSIILMRALRHEPKVYLQKEYQIRNVFSVGILVLASWFFSMKFVLAGFAFVIKFLYSFVAVPVIMVIAIGIGYVLMGVLQAVKWIFSKAGVQTSFIEEVIENMQGSGGALQAKVAVQSGNTVLWQIILIICVIAVIISLIFFFRWLSGRKRKTSDDLTNLILRENRINHHTPDLQSTRGYSRSAVYKVRGQYKRFLKMYLGKGTKLRCCDTSLDVEKTVANMLQNKTADQELQELRSIYMKARYNHEASKEDVRRAKELCSLFRNRLGK